jgi:hypothetical protein
MRTTTIAAAIVVIIVVIGAGYFLYTYMAPGYGTLRLYMTDTPAYSGNITSITITFSEIDLSQIDSYGNETWIVLTSTAATIDLLQILNVTQSLGNFSVPVGNYTQIRFMTSTATAMINGTAYNLTIPSGAETGLKVHFPTTLQIVANGTVTVTIDITADNDGIHNGHLIPSMSATFTYGDHGSPMGYS